MKQSRVFFIGTLIYLVLFLFDYIYTLFSINESGLYRTLLGLDIHMTMNNEEMITAFSPTIQIFITLCIWLIFLFTLNLIFKKFKTKNR